MPGKHVSVDQLVSSTPGLIAQLSGKLTTQRYKYATVYIDHYSCYCFVHMQKTASVQETLEGNVLFKQLCANQGIHIQAYHADNGVFQVNGWVDHWTKNQQGLTIAGVGTHHQNGLAEQHICTLQDLTRTNLAHAHAEWPEAITPHLWPYTMCSSNEILNETPLMQDDRRRSPT